MMLYIVEGMDLTGKSTFCQELKRYTNASIYKFNRRPKDDSEVEIQKLHTHYLTVIELLTQMNSNIHILDRFHLSQQVYSILRGTDEMNLLFYDYLEAKIKSIPHLLIHCTSPMNVILQRLDQRGDNYINEHQLGLLSMRYEKAFNKSTLNKIQINTTNLKESCREVLDYAEQ